MAAKLRTSRWRVINLRRPRHFTACARFRCACSSPFWPAPHLPERRAPTTPSVEARGSASMGCAVPRRARASAWRAHARRRVHPTAPALRSRRTQTPTPSALPTWVRVWRASATAPARVTPPQARRAAPQAACVTWPRCAEPRAPAPPMASRRARSSAGRRAVRVISQSNARARALNVPPTHAPLRARSAGQPGAPATWPSRAMDSPTTARSTHSPSR